MTFEEWKAAYLKQIAEKGIKVAWDGGHAYHTDDCIEPDYCNSFEDEEKARTFQNNYWFEHGPELFCAVELIEGRAVVSCCSHEFEGREEEIAYIEGFLSLYERQGWGKWYEETQLLAYVEELRANLQMDELLEEETASVAATTDGKGDSQETMKHLLTFAISPEERRQVDEALAKRTGEN